MSKPKLSVVVVSYNTKILLENCLSSIREHEDEVKMETIVVDNNSSDRSTEMVEDKFPDFTLIKNNKNLGFAKANNKAKDIAKGNYVLFLNSDTTITKGAMKETVEYLDADKNVGSLTCKIVLPGGELDKDTRRSFPTPWVAFSHLVLRLDRVFPNSKVFGRYWYGYISEDEIHEVDVIQGAFHMSRKKVLDEVGWFDEDYFLDGEDIDLCWKIKEKGWKIIYYPKVKIIHHKKASKNAVTTKKEKKRVISSGVDSMEKFYKKRLWNDYPALMNYLVILGIKTVKFVRKLKLEINK